MGVSILDHCPIMLKFDIKPYGNKHFKFGDKWLHDCIFKEILQNQLQISRMGTNMFKLVTFQKCLQKHLSWLNKSKYGAVHQKRGIARTQLLVVQHELHEDPLNVVLQQQDQQVRDQYIGTLFASLKLMHQQSKMDWKMQVIIALVVSLPW